MLKTFFIIFNNFSSFYVSKKLLGVKENKKTKIKKKILRKTKFFI